MKTSKMQALESLATRLEGELHLDTLHTTIYATDASVYKRFPLAVAFPKTVGDIKILIEFATQNNTSLVPRTAGTSLAGQCVGEGIIVDVSKHFNQIVDFDEIKSQVTVQPGVIRDSLNDFLEPFGVFFGPNTSTSNRCMLGGMVGNNSSGTTSIQYGVTRDKIVWLDMLLYDGSLVRFCELSANEFNQKCALDSAEGHIYRKLHELLNNSKTRSNITATFPKPEIHRRNTGYALDTLMDAEPYGGTKKINVCNLIAGSEGTLGIIVGIKLQTDPLPPKRKALVAAQYNSVAACLNDVQSLMQHKLYSCEMLDKVILDCTNNNTYYKQHRDWIAQDPKAVLLLELRSDKKKDLIAQTVALCKTIATNNNAYAYPVLQGERIDFAMELRKAGLGLLGNMVGDAKAVACIEDTAVSLEDLAPYIAEFSGIMQTYEQDIVYYAHAGAGELHLRPILNLKDQEDVDRFKEISTTVAHLVKRYNGSLSGEHGDGIVRGSLLPLMLGDTVYGYLEVVKKAFDPNKIFNPGKIVASYVIDQGLRYNPEKPVTKPIETYLDFSESIDIHRAAEQCNGSGDCRKLPESKGTMCPSYHATRDEKDTTRARANMLREALNNTEALNAFNNQDLKHVMDLCISCKACATECPSNVNVAKFKAEFMYQYNKANKPSPKVKRFANSTAITKKLAVAPKLVNAVLFNGFLSPWVKKYSGIAQERSLPLLSTRKFNARANAKIDASKKTVYLYIDEFSNYYESHIAQDALKLLSGLGYKVQAVVHLESGRALLSKGFLEKATQIANTNIDYFKDKLTPNAVLVGIEPSAILSFRDEFTYMATHSESAKQIAQHTYLIEEFISNEFEQGIISSEQFTGATKKVKIHSHCYQKALSNQKFTFDMLNIPENYKPTIIASGCCGMAGSFGYEQEHYQVSMKIGETTLFPAIRKTSPETIIAANGTSCRHQIKDGTKREALHPVSILVNAML